MEESTEESASEKVRVPDMLSLLEPELLTLAMKKEQYCFSSITDMFIDCLLLLFELVIVLGFRSGHSKTPELKYFLVWGSKYYNFVYEFF